MLQHSRTSTQTLPRVRKAGDVAIAKMISTDKVCSHCHKKADICTKATAQKQQAQELRPHHDYTCAGAGAGSAAVVAAVGVAVAFGAADATCCFWQHLSSAAPSG